MITFAFIVAFELFAFVVICIMVNENGDNSILTSISLLVEGTMYGDYRTGGVFVLQVIFTIVQILMIILLCVYLVKDTKQDFTSDVALDLLEIDRLFNLNDNNWQSLVRPISLFAPIVAIF